MLVDPIQLVKTPEMTNADGRTCRSIVWLNRFDIGDSRSGKPISFPVELLPIIRGKRLGKDRELTGIRIGASSVVDQGPDSLVECCSQTLKKIPENQKQIHMGLLKLDAVSNPIQFRFVLGRDGVGIVAEGKDFRFQAIQVKLRPIGLTTSIG
jgi:hypothetical protein